MGSRSGADVLLDRLPEEEQLPAAEGADVVDALEQHAVLEAVADGPDVVVDAFRQLFGGKVRGAHQHSPMQVSAIT